MNHKKIPYQNISIGTSTDGYLDKLESFLEEVLESFNLPIVAGENENQLTEKIYRHLQIQNNKKGLPFYFQPEALQKPINGKGHDRRSDLGVNLDVEDINMELIYCIEAKRLPTDKSGYRREKEYVLGNDGGIERYKNNHHGKNRNGDLLKRNGMIGYVEENDFVFWEKRINNWIEFDTIWGVSEKLNSKYKKLKSAGYESKHSRITNEIVSLKHFWIDLK